MPNNRAANLPTLGSRIAATLCAAALAPVSLLDAAPIHGPAFVPNDELFPEQWHLVEDDQYPHINVQKAWARGLTGEGVTIGIVEGGVEWNHPDLLANYEPSLSYDFRDNDPDPMPLFTPNSLIAGHGTQVAGAAVAVGGNEIGVTGVAPEASLAGLRIRVSDFRNQGPAAYRYFSTGLEPQIDIKNHSYGARDYDGSSSWDGFTAFAESSRAGTIHVVAGGNYRGTAGFEFAGYSGDANKGHLATHPDTIAVASVWQDDRYANYSNFGANIFVAAPAGFETTTLTDRGDYSPFSGTSASTPLVSGALALAKQANPALDVRMAKHLLALTSDNLIDADDQTPESDGGWRTNAAGYQFNQNYGFGLLDVDALTRAAAEYEGVTEFREWTTRTISSIVDLPDASTGGELESSSAIERKFFIPVSGQLEEMMTRVVMVHDDLQQVEVTLTSPSGTTSRLAIGIEASGDVPRSANWFFKSNAFWGEEAFGEWTLTLEDKFEGGTGTLLGYEGIVRIGSLIPISVPEPLSMALASIACSSLLSKRRKN